MSDTEENPTEAVENPEEQEVTVEEHADTAAGESSTPLDVTDGGEMNETGADENAAQAESNEVIENEVTPNEETDIATGDATVPTDGNISQTDDKSAPTEELVGTVDEKTDEDATKPPTEVGVSAPTEEANDENKEEAETPNEEVSAPIEEQKDENEDETEPTNEEETVSPNEGVSAPTEEVKDDNEDKTEPTSEGVSGPTEDAKDENEDETEPTNEGVSGPTEEAKDENEEETVSPNEAVSAPTEDAKDENEEETVSPNEGVSAPTEEKTDENEEETVSPNEGVSAPTEEAKDENEEETEPTSEGVSGPTEDRAEGINNAEGVPCSEGQGTITEGISALTEEVASAPTETAPVEAAGSPKPAADVPTTPRYEAPAAAPLAEDEEERVELPPLIVNAQPPPIGSPPLVKDIDDHVPKPGMDMSAQTKSDMPEPQSADDATATVKLLLMPSGQTVTKTLKLRVTFGEVIEILGKDLRMPPNVLEMLFNGKVVEHNFRLEDYGIEANGTVAFEVNSTEPLTYPMREFVPRDPLGGMADVITVRIQMDDNNYRDIVVEIERTGMKKPFLGGYRHKRSGAVYHHAAMQTNPKVRNVPIVERYSRDTQTWEGRHRVQQTFNTTSTQMTKPGVFITNATDKLIIPNGYETADEYRARILAKVIVLQRYLRGWLAKRYVSKLREDKQKREDYEKMEELRKRQEKEERVRKDFQRRMNPKSKEDFDLLYSALEKWRQEELSRINSTMRGAERKAALYLLLEQETELIAAIDRHQLDANSENKDKGIQRLLSKAAASKKWRNTEGKLLEVDTPYTLRGKELLDIYNSLSMKYLTQDERLDVLLTLKHTVKEHDCKLTQEIVELIDREADLLMRGVKEDNLAGLRKRITTLFLQYCKTPLFNPEMARLLKVPQDPSVLRQDIHFCVSCGRYLQSTEFSLGIKSTGIGRCRRCLRQDNLARMREDQSAYKYLLQDLRRREETFHDNDRIAFLIEEDDVRYLVDNIWEGMSVLSSWNDLADLELVRWNYAAEWSPWNTALLTKDEAEAHRKLVDLEQAYGSILVHRVKQKHVLAKNYFHKLKHMVEKMRIMELELENVRQTTK